MAAQIPVDSGGWHELKAQHLIHGQRAPILVEDQVIQWMAELMRLPSQSSGILLASERAANILGLAVARHASCGFGCVLHFRVAARDSTTLRNSLPRLRASARGSRRNG